MDARAPRDLNGLGNVVLRRKRGRQLKGNALTDLPIRRGERRHLDTRSDDRHAVYAHAFPITYRDSKREVRLVNVSGGGALIECRLRPHLGEHVDLHLGERGTIECVVRWVKDGRIGLEFAHETQLNCSDQDWIALLRSVMRNEFTDERSPDAELSNVDREPRSATRHPLLWTGELLYGPSSWSVRLRNVSETGALVQCARPPQEGSEIVLDLGGSGSVTGTISWAVGDHIGVKFDEPFDMRRLAKSKPRIVPPTWQRPGFLENDVSSDSTWDEAWSRMSPDELREELEGFLKR